MVQRKTDYSLLDSGDGRRLERFGDIILDRPAPQAFWKPHLGPSDWDRADAVYERSNKGGGDWSQRHPMPGRWVCTVDDWRFVLKPTGFGHVGLFPEQIDNWRLIDARIRARGGDLDVFNIFGYTGAATVVAAKAGARVCHLDSSKGIVQWGREMIAENGLSDAPVRWLVEDAAKFLKREQRRGRRYHGIILDPPAYGRGNKGEVWKIEEGLGQLLELARGVLDSDAPDFVMLSTNSPKFTPLVLHNMLADAFADLGGTIQATEMSNTEQGRGRIMPNGVTACWLAER